MTRFDGLHLYILIFVVLFGYPLPVIAEPVYKAHVRAELISDTSTIAPGQNFWIGLHLTMDEGWHTYWRNSGDSGLATHIQWDLPKDFGAGDIQWPYPKRFDYSQGLAGYGYDGEVILLTEIWPPEELSNGKKYQIDAQVRWLSCEKICVPGSAKMSISFDMNRTDVQFDERVLELFNEEKLKWPIVSDGWQLDVVDKGDEYLLNIAQKKGEISITDLDFFPYRNDIIDHSAHQTFQKVGEGYQLSVLKVTLLEEKIPRIQGILISPEGWESSGQNQALFFDAPVD